MQVTRGEIIIIVIFVLVLGWRARFGDKGFVVLHGVARCMCVYEGRLVKPVSGL